MPRPKTNTLGNRMTARCRLDRAKKAAPYVRTYSDGYQFGLAARRLGTPLQDALKAVQGDSPACVQGTLAAYQDLGEA